jgi:hypothetical protein
MSLRYSNMLESNLAALNQEHVSILVRNVPHRLLMALLINLGISMIERARSITTTKRGARRRARALQTFVRVPIICDSC